MQIASLQQCSTHRIPKAGDLALTSGPYILSVLLFVQGERTNIEPEPIFAEDCLSIDAKRAISSGKVSPTDLHESHISLQAQILVA